MTKALTQAVIERINGEPMVDWDQRSAIGIARTWVGDRKPLEKSIIPGYEKRDQLAADLVGLMVDARPADCVSALVAAREVVNAPFVDPDMASYRAERLKRGELVVAKKPKRESKSE